jgi:DNA-binding transcriptional LysR family regulator
LDDGKVKPLQPLRIDATVLDLNDFYYFVQVVDRGGFTAASRGLRVPKSTLSHRIQELEHGLGVRLLHRTSRRFGVTDAGREFYEHAVAMLREAEEAQSAMRYRLTEPKGTIRITTPVAGEFVITEVVSRFLPRYPKVNVVSHVTDDFVDIVAQNYDVAVRAHSAPLPDSTLVARKLAPAPWFLFAGARYLAAHGSPETPDDLANHAALLMTHGNGGPEWRLRHVRDACEQVVSPLVPRITSGDMIGLKNAAVGGLGIVALPGCVGYADVRSGALRRVLPDWIAGEATLTALMPHRQSLLPAVRAFVDCLAAEVPKLVLV